MDRLLALNELLGFNKDAAQERRARSRGTSAVLLQPRPGRWREPGINYVFAQVHRVSIASRNL
jgi:hypothetical protein